MSKAGEEKKETRLDVISHRRKVQLSD